MSNWNLLSLENLLNFPIDSNSSTKVCSFKSDTPKESNEIVKEPENHCSNPPVLAKNSTESNSANFLDLNLYFPANSFREITEKENPYLIDDAIPGATDMATAMMLETHSELEVIEDMARLGYEKRVKGPASMLNIFNQHPEYDYDRGEANKIRRYSPEEVVTIIAKDWPKRIYDSENVKMNDKQLREQKKLMYEHQVNQRNMIEKTLSKSNVVTRRKGKAVVVETDSEDTDTENDDFSISGH